jgi:di/tricarboxylate transporter
MIAIISLLSLVIAIIIGFWKNINVGLIALFFSLFIGYYLGGIPINTIISYWPMKLFFTTFGITLLFSIAKLNGTLEKISKTIIFQSKGRKVLIPIIFYFLAVVIASVGPGNISTSALLLPIGLVIAYKTKISVLMMSVLIILGSIAGGLSPLAPNGIVALELAKTHGVGDLNFKIYIVNVISMTLFSGLVFLFLGGLKYRGERIEISKASKFDKNQIITLTSILILVVWVIIGKVNVGFAAFALSAILLILNTADQDQAIKHVPWSTILLICGTAVLISVISELGGVDLLTNFLASLMNKSTAVPILAILSGVMSIFSSAVGVVMPTLIPTTVSLSNELGQVVTPAALTITIAVASHIVTMSPFSTMGALAMASLPETVDRKYLFKYLFIVAFLSLIFIAIFLGIILGFGYLG